VPFDGVFRLQAARLEVVARVDHAAIAAALVQGRPRLLLEHDDPASQLGQMAGRAGADRAGADHDRLGVHFLATTTSVTAAPTSWAITPSRVTGSTDFDV